MYFNKIHLVALIIDLRCRVKLLLLQFRRKPHRRRHRWYRRTIPCKLGDPQLGDQRPAVRLINVLRARFSYKILASKNLKPKRNYKKLHNYILYEKCVREMLIKSTPGWVSWALIFKRDAITHGDGDRKGSSCRKILILMSFVLVLLPMLSQSVVLRQIKRFPQNLVYFLEMPWTQKSWKHLIKRKLLGTSCLAGNNQHI